jgi:H+/Cl- antiporter ClcA
VAEDATRQPLPERAYIGGLVLAALIGVPVAIAATAFLSVVHDLEHWIWVSVPDSGGWSEPPGWYVVVVPVVGALLVAAALRLPGHGGHSAIDGMSLDAPSLVALPSVLLAAIATLSFGMVLGPEAPLIALGLSLGAFAARLVKAGETGTPIIALAGGFAAIASILGGPVVAAFMLFELVAASGTVPANKISRLLLPGFVAAGTGALVFLGINDWRGIHLDSLTLPPLPDYPTVRLVDVAWSIPLAAAIAVVVALCRRGAKDVAAAAARRPDVVLVAGGAAVGLLAVLFRAVSDRPAELLLFSGQNTLPQVIAEGSAGVLVALILLKGVAYAISLGAGFRGGPIFPAITLGVAGGVLASQVLPGLDLTPAVVAGLAAGGAAGLSLPFFGALIAVVLVGPASSDSIPIAIVAAAVAWLVTLAVARPAPAREGSDARAGGR